VHASGEASDADDAEIDASPTVTLEQIRALYGLSAAPAPTTRRRGARADCLDAADVMLASVDAVDLLNDRDIEIFRRKHAPDSQMVMCQRDIRTYGNKIQSNKPQYGVPPSGRDSHMTLLSGVAEVLIGLDAGVALEVRKASSGDVLQEGVPVVQHQSHTDPLLPMLFSLSPSQRKAGASAGASPEHLPRVIVFADSVSEQHLSAQALRRLNVEMMKLALRGVTVVAAAGTDGAAMLSEYGNSGKLKNPEFHPFFPASSPWVVSVTLSSGTAHPLTAHPRAGGGFSTVFPPSPLMQSLIQPYLESKKTLDELPDDSLYNRRGHGLPVLAMVGSTTITHISVDWTLRHSGVSAAVAAAVLSRVNLHRERAARPMLGAAGPLLLRSCGESTVDIARGGSGYTGALCAACLDMRWGCSCGFEAAPGWDPASGCGGVDYERVIEVLEGKYGK
jgi:hypothetical protein